LSFRRNLFQHNHDTQHSKRFLRNDSHKGSELSLNRAFWYIAKALQVLGLLIVLVGILTGLSNPLGDAEFRAETRSAIIGVVVFAAGWLIEKKLAD
jgi:hypothetical protein